MGIGVYTKEIICHLVPYSVIFSTGGGGGVILHA